MGDDEWPYLIEYVAVATGLLWVAILVPSLLHTLDAGRETFLQIALS